MSANPYAAPAAPLVAGDQRKPVSKAALLLLTFFFGGIGGHKFYLGKYVQGVLYLLFFWTGIPALIALVEFLVYCFTSSERLSEKYTASGTAVVLAIIALALLLIIGLFAAIAVPAHYDRVYRSRAAEAWASARTQQQGITEHYLEHKRFPERVADLPPELALGAAGVLTWTFPADAGDIAGSTLVFRPRPGGGTLEWDCKGGTLVMKYRVHACR